MKKVSLLIVSLLFIIPLSVSAADTEYKVETLEATVSGSTINYKGTMEAGATAVTCKLYDKDNKEVDTLSSAVDQQKFEDKFENVANGDYTVGCAFYSGGDVKSVEVTVEEDKQTEPAETTDETTNKESSKETSKKSKNPKTSDNILVYISLITISLIGLGFVSFKLKKN